ncbi:endonuclease/exonuclease/phosphatase family protein [Cellulophaga lytica]|uniref:Endonuclease/exonuclease/phosphatase n=1 Tax=Cellulophaga lytica (strain ATCC 23178 / DSM 7489 / JCM 8516 / NBRC 14961 / NCIMB 1423 / VKM B-1433 / Cy l20) TaxID=867900 RepID=F0REW0_CELLC|nr:endonuclease/exonuclease/phosphatase family protein [Cellulophaga lytica]ADY28915.1 Endonuclease/exonuclease/phosphatase [Cellulophaga lytica DSM 7489]WQG76910.1 endonuclease/exonuclease/phosphatase family protein [Cellulophaga lytica]
MNITSKCIGFFLIIYLCTKITLIAQSKQRYQIRTIAFYNLENLFDTINNPNTFDDDRTPLGKDKWTSDKYMAKLKNMSTTLAKIGSSVTNSSPDIIGVCEVENDTVLTDLIQQPALINKGYGVIHYNSPDERGIDVALLYKKQAFIPTSFKSHRLLLFKDSNYRDYTRDQLIVGGLLDNEEIYFIVNHWPSRSGGEARSRPNRIAAAILNKRIIDSVKRVNINAKIISMGDFNDDPTNKSFKKVLQTEGRLKKVSDSILFNPMDELYRKGEGSLAYRDKWNVFDQIFFTGNLVNKQKDSYSFWKACIYNAPYLITSKGRYKGYPKRTYSGGSYTGGYSDHFPVYIYLIRKEDN